MKTIYLTGRDPYIIGQTGESNAVTLRVDVDEWKDAYDGGHGILTFRWPNKTVYPLDTNLVQYNDKYYLEAIVTSNETRYPGWVVVQAQWYDGETLVYSRAFSCKVLQSHDGYVPGGDTVPTWVTALIARLDAMDDTEAAVETYKEGAELAAQNAADSLSAAQAAAESAGASAATATQAAETATQKADSIPPEYTSMVSHIAEVFDAAKAYSAGEYVWNNVDSKLYLFTKDHAAGEWTGTDANEVVLADDVGGLKSAVETNTNIIKLDADATVAFTTENSGYGVRFSDGTLIGNSYLCTTNYIDVSAFSKMKYKRIGVTSGTPTYGMAFYDAEKVYLPGSGERAKLSAEAFGYLEEMAELTVPQNATYVRFSVLRDANTYGSFAVSGNSALYDLKAEADESKADIVEIKNNADAIERILNDAQGAEITNIPFEITDIGNGVRFSTGEPYPLSTLNSTGFIDVSAYAYLRYKRVASTDSAPVYGMAFYDAEKAYLPDSGVRALTNASAFGYASDLADIVVPEGAVYVRFTTLADTTVYGEFEVYGKTRLRITADNAEQSSEILALQSDPIELPYHIGYYGRYIIFSDGTATSGSTTYYNYTDYVDVSKFSKLTYRRITSTVATPQMGMAFYDKDKQFISGQRAVPNQEALGYVETVIAVPDGAVYARFTTLRDTASYGYLVITGVSKLYDLIGRKSPFRKNVMIAQCAPEWYSAQGESYEGFTINTTYAEMITKWDELVSGSKGYVTKEEIGSASDGQKMYCYKMIPMRYRNNTGSSIENNAPVFLIIPSIHGYEKSAAYGTYYFARDLVYNFNKNAVLNSLRTKAILYVIPVGNPYGFDNKTRKNANGVDCNRNWGPDPSGETDPTSPEYPGAEPFDQPEVQAIKSVIDSTSNLFYVVDYHTDGQYKAASWANVNWIAWGASVVDEEYSSRSYIASQFHLADISENLPLEYDFDTNGETIGSITLGAASAPRPTITYYSRTALHILGGTFEGNNGLPISSDSAYSPMEQKINSELIGNWIKNLMLVYRNV